MAKNQSVISEKGLDEKQTHQSHMQADALSQPLSSLLTAHPTQSSSDQENATMTKHTEKNRLAKTGKDIPPVEKWQPKHLGSMDLTITANGEWWHEGTRMVRQKLIDLFASILWKETDVSTGKDQYFLKTPVEKVAICVADVPLMVTDVVQFHEAGQDWLQFTTSTGDVVNADANHAIEMRAFTHTEHGKSSTQMRPYIRVRQNLDAFINRNTFYHLAEMGELVAGTEKDTDTQLVLHSGGATFRLAAS